MSDPYIYNHLRLLIKVGPKKNCVKYVIGDCHLPQFNNSEVFLHIFQSKILELQTVFPLRNRNIKLRFFRSLNHIKMVYMADQHFIWNCAKSNDRHIIQLVRKAGYRTSPIDERHDLLIEKFNWINNWMINLWYNNWCVVQWNSSAKFKHQIDRQVYRRSSIVLRKTI